MCVAVRSNEQHRNSRNAYPRCNCNRSIPVDSDLDRGVGIIRNDVCDQHSAECDGSWGRSTFVRHVLSGIDHYVCGMYVGWPDRTDGITPGWYSVGPANQTISRAGCKINPYGNIDRRSEMFVFVFETVPHQLCCACQKVS